MFLISVTRRPVPTPVVPTSVRSFTLGEWVVTAATDGWLSTLDYDDARVVVSEAPPQRGGDDAMLFSRARVSLHDRSIELTRTLLGGRQVYYHLSPGGEFFCASHARLLRDAGVPLEEDPERLGELFVYRYVSAPRTLFKGIDQLAAGQRLRFHFEGGAWRPAAAERYAPPQPHRGPLAGGAPASHENGHGRYGLHGERTREALCAAMAALAPAKDRVRVLASGGLDSSILFKIAQAEFGTDQGYSTGYPFESEADDVEKRYALTAAEAFGVRHHHFVPTTEEFQRGVLECIWLAEEPIVHTQSVLMMLMFRRGLPAGDGTVVVGQGADGAFGLRLHRLVGRVDRFAGSHPRLADLARPLLSAVAPVLATGPAAAAVRRGLSWLRRDPGVLDLAGNRWGPKVALGHDRHVLWQLGVAGPERWVRRRFDVTHDQIIANRLRALEGLEDRSVLDQISLLDFLTDVSVTQSIWSKFGEAAQKVVYYPFNARELLDSAFETPWSMKLAEPKGVLRDVARKLGVPEFIVSRSKANFNIKSNDWALPGGVLEPLVPLAAKVYDPAEMTRTRTSGQKGAYAFWTMLNHAIWKRLFVNQEPLHVLTGELEHSMGDWARGAKT